LKVSTFSPAEKFTALDGLPNRRWNLAMPIRKEEDAPRSKKTAPGVSSNAAAAPPPGPAPNLDASVLIVVGPVGAPSQGTIACIPGEGYALITHDHFRNPGLDERDILYFKDHGEEFFTGSSTNFTFCCVIHNIFYTRRGLGGLGPLCGIGVSSRIDAISMPLLENARIEDSLPDSNLITSAIFGEYGDFYIGSNKGNLYKYSLKKHVLDYSLDLECLSIEKIFKICCFEGIDIIAISGKKKEGSEVTFFRSTDKECKPFKVNYILNDFR